MKTYFNGKILFGNFSSPERKQLIKDEYPKYGYVNVSYYMTLQASERNWNYSQNLFAQVLNKAINDGDIKSYEFIQNVNYSLLTFNKFLENITWQAINPDYVLIVNTIPEEGDNFTKRLVDKVKFNFENLYPIPQKEHNIYPDVIIKIAKNLNLHPSQINIIPATPESIKAWVNKNEPESDIFEKLKDHLVSERALHKNKSIVKRPIIVDDKRILKLSNLRKNYNYFYSLFEAECNNNPQSKLTYYVGKIAHQPLFVNNIIVERNEFFNTLYWILREWNVFSKYFSYSLDEDIIIHNMLATKEFHIAIETVMIENGFSAYYDPQLREPDFEFKMII